MATALTPLARAFAHEADAGLRLSTALRTIAALVIAFWTLVENSRSGRWYFFLVTLVFVGLGFVPLAVRRLGVRSLWPLYLTTLVDVAFFTLAVTHPGGFDSTSVPPQVRLRFGNELYLFLFPVSTLLVYEPRLVLWTAVVAAVCWSVAVLNIIAQPDTIASVSTATWLQLSETETVQLFLDPRFVSVGLWGRLVVILLVFGATLAVVVQRSRRLVERQVAAERARSNLARYFSPNVVEDLAQSDEPLRTSREQSVAVLFADIVGFTAATARATPEAVIGLVRACHAHLVAAVFAHGGTIDKYLGDGLMVTFGTPQPGRTDATRALQCSLAMQEAIRGWNVERARAGEAPVRVSVGVHYGLVVLGDIGDHRQLEFAVLGATVNAASRVEQLTRELDVGIAVTDAVIARARAEGASADVLDRFSSRGDRVLRGLPDPVGLFAVCE